MIGRIAPGFVALAMVVTILAGQCGANAAKAPPSPEELTKAIFDPAKPGPEHAKLEPLIGSWTYTCKCWMDPTQPPIEMKGTIERKWVLGGRFLEERIAGTGLDGKPGLEGLGIYGYDSSQKKYRLTFACTMGTDISTSLGVAEASGKFIFQTTCNCPLTKTIIQGRDELRIESKDKVVLDSYKTIDGKEVKGMEIIAVRRR
jgi:hypothetical protein